jgi:hypothetical protein
MGQAKQRGTFEERINNAARKKEVMKLGKQEFEDLIIFLDAQRRVDCNDILKRLNQSYTSPDNGRTIVYDGEIMQEAIRKKNEILAQRKENN